MTIYKNIFLYHSFIPKWSYQQYTCIHLYNACVLASLICMHTLLQKPSIHSLLPLTHHSLLQAFLTYTVRHPSTCPPLFHLLSLSTRPAPTYAICFPFLLYPIPLRLSVLSKKKQFWYLFDFTGLLDIAIINDED